MSNPANSKSTDVSLFDLLRKAGLIGDGVRVGEMAVEWGWQIGDIVVRQLRLNENQAGIVTTIWLYVNRDLMSVPMALRTLALLAQTNTNNELIGIVYPRCGSLLGELLLRAGVIDNRQLLAALIGSETNQMQLGKFLVLKGEVSAPMINAALQVQKAIRNGAVTVDDGVSVLSEVRSQVWSA